MLIIVKSICLIYSVLVFKRHLSKFKFASIALIPIFIIINKKSYGKSIKNNREKSKEDHG